MKALLEAAQKRSLPDRRCASGFWYKVVLTPDLRSGDRFCVGVILQDRMELLHHRFMAHFDRLRCLYGDEIEEHTRFLLQVLRNHLTDGNSLSAMPSVNLHIEGPFYASGNSIDDILNKLYDAVIPIGKAPISRELRQESAFQAVTNQKARTLVYEQLDQLIGLEKTHNLIPKVDFIEIKTPKGKCRLDIPLRPLNHYGSIVSACYKSTDSIQKQLLKAQLDLNAAMRTHPVNRCLGLFILRPNAQMRLTASELQAADDALDEVLWKMSSERYLIEADDDPKQLAKQVADWAI